MVRWAPVVRGLCTVAVVLAETESWRSLEFYNEGLVKSSQKFVLHDIPVFYAEPENVSVSPGSWSVGPRVPYLFLVAPDKDVRGKDHDCSAQVLEGT
jgi:hypothetical protein